MRQLKILIQSYMYVLITVLKIQYLRQRIILLQRIWDQYLIGWQLDLQASTFCIFLLSIKGFSQNFYLLRFLQQFDISLFKIVHKFIRISHLASKNFKIVSKSLEVVSLAFSIKYNKFQSQRKMSSEDIVNYLIEIGSNERKLQYCRQILAQNSFFTPEAAFNINSSQIKTTLFKSQLLELFKSTGITSTAQELELIFQYFQIDGKNVVTLQQFSTIVLPQTQISQDNNKKCEKYQLKYSLQKFFLQILENQTLLERHNRMKKKDEQANPKTSFKKLTLEHLKSFLTLHGKYPSQSMLQQILKELLLNKGSGNRSKLVAQYILQVNESAKVNIPESKKEQVKPIERNNQAKAPRISTDIVRVEQKSQNAIANNLPLKSILPGNQSINPFATKLNDSGPKSQKNEICSVQERIKSLMSSVNMKGPTKTQIKRQVSTKESSSNKVKEDQLDVKKKSFQTERQFGEIKLYQNFNVEDKQRVIKKSHIQDNEFCFKMKKYKKSKVFSQDNSDNISFDIHSRHIFCTNNDQRPTIEPMKQNKAITKQKPEKQAKNEKSKRISYLKSLVGQSSAGKPKHLQTYRI